jgi:hypothetical protein
LAKLPVDPEGAKIPGGYVHLTRQIYESSLWTMPPYCRVVAITCLALANYQTKKWFDRYAKRDVLLNRGEFVTSVRGLADYCHVSQSLVQLALAKLQQHGFLKTRVRKGHYTLITIVKYNYYNDPKSYIKQGFIGGIGTPTGTGAGTLTGTLSGTPEGTPSGTEAGNNLSSKEVKKERKKEGPPSNGFQPPQPVNTPEIFLASQFRVYISKRTGLERCALEFKEALGRGLDSGELNAAIEARWNHDVIVWKWIEAFEKVKARKEEKPEIFRAKDDDEKNKKEVEKKKESLVPDDKRIQKELHDALIKTKIKPKVKPDDVEHKTT